jgi:hypothetical protein
VLHGRLYVSAFLCHVRILPPAMACCVHPACAEQLDDLQHVFLECPVVQPAAAWVCRLFAAVAGGHPPPAHPRVLLADDLSLWRPSPNLQFFWTHLRASYLHVVWQLYSRRSIAGAEFSAPAICAVLVAALTAAIWRDWKM